jgi:rod shape-determining protein MreD
VTILTATLWLVLCLILQAAIGQWVPEAHRYVDSMLWPVVWYAITQSQRSAMLVGCAAGLLQDAWFGAGIFGVHGITKTILGWVLGGLGARFDLNHLGGRLAGGGLFFIAERFVEMGIFLLLGLSVVRPAVADLAMGAVVNAAVVTVLFGLIDKVRGRSRRAVPLRRRA